MEVINEGYQTKYADNENFFKESKIQKGFLAKVFIVYLLSFIPPIATILYITTSGTQFEFLKTNTLLIPTAPLVFIISSFSLAFSKRVARVFPINVFVFLLFLATFSLLSALCSQATKPEVVLSALCSFAAIALGLTIYTVASPKNFGLKRAFTLCLVLVFIPTTFFFIHSREDRWNEVLIAALALMSGTVIMSAAQGLAANSKFYLLTNDIIMGAMKVFLVLPMLPDLDEEESV